MLSMSDYQSHSIWSAGSGAQHVRLSKVLSMECRFWCLACQIIKGTQYGVWVMVLSMSDYQSHSVWSAGSGT